MANSKVGISYIHHKHEWINFLMSLSHVLEEEDEEEEEEEEEGEEFILTSFVAQPCR